MKEERIRDIEKAYQTKNMSSKILVTKPHHHLIRKNKEETIEAPIDFVD